MNQQISPSIEIVLIKEEIAENCVLQDGNNLEGEEAMEENDEFSTIEKPEKIIDNIQYSSSLCEELHIENFLNRVKKETAFNLIHEEIQIKDEHLFEATDTDLEDKSNNKLLNKEANKPDWNSTFSEGGKNKGMDQNENKVKRLECDRCYKAFHKSSDLKKHSRIHTGERPFKCTICEKSFSQLNTMITHKRTHTGEKPYECDVCHKTFNQMYTLTTHKRIHNNERPFQCSVCQKTFRKSGDRSRHMRIHTGEKPFHCQFCQYKFALADNLKKHMRTHTGEKPFTCKHCQKPLSTSSILKMHMRTLHNDKI